MRHALLAALFSLVTACAMDSEPELDFEDVADFTLYSSSGACMKVVYGGPNAGETIVGTAFGSSTESADAARAACSASCSRYPESNRVSGCISVY